MSHEAPFDGDRQQRSTRRVIALVAVALVLVGALTALVVRGPNGTTALSPTATPSEPALSSSAASPGPGLTGTATAGVTKSPTARRSPTPTTPAAATTRTAGNNPRPPSTRSPVPIRTVTTAGAVGYRTPRTLLPAARRPPVAAATSRGTATATEECADLSPSMALIDLDESIWAFCQPPFLAAARADGVS